MACSKCCESNECCGHSLPEESCCGCPLPSTCCGCFCLIAVITIIIVAIIIVIALGATGVFQSKKATETYEHAAVASASETCSNIGKNIMKESNGNAVDAAVAVAICLGVVEFQSSGLGGGGFLLFYQVPRLPVIGLLPKAGRIFAVDFRSTAPKDTIAANLNNAKEYEKPGLFVATPGELYGLYQLWITFKSNNVDWADLLRPSIDLAEQGFKVSADLEKAAEELDAGDPRDGHYKYLDDPNFSSLRSLVKPNGKLIRKGQIIKRPDLAQTLKTIAESIVSPFNEELAIEIQNFQGIMQTSDFASYVTTAESKQVSLDNGGTLYGPDLPSSTVLQFFIRNVLKDFSMISADAKSLLFYHRLLESFKFAFGRRNVLGDPKFSSGLSELTEKLSGAFYAKSIQEMIKDQSVQSSKMKYYKGNGVEGWTTYPKIGEENNGGTTHFSVIDEDGSAVSMTTSIGTKFGSKIVSPSTGIVYNNDMTAFSYSGSDANFGLPINKRNYPQPFKRPMSSMCPVIAVDAKGQVSLAIGGAGGPRIITSVAMAISQHILLGQSLSEAINSPRIHHQLSPYALYPEDDVDKTVLEQLDQYEKNVYKNKATFVIPEMDVPSKISAVHGISRDQSSGRLTAVCDKRLAGKPSGY